MEKKKVGAGIGVMLFKDGKILLGKRHDNPEKASSLLHGEGSWTMPGGKLDFGESFEEGARRETKEETGIDLENVKVICVNNDMVESAHFITIGMYSEDFKGEPQVLEPDEITEWKWFDLDDLPTPLFFPSKRVLENYKQGKFYIKQ
ncbi:MAG: NUDIX domain-containing protein [Nanoarchaeota archaeon]|nr:NUDIX domain-containing protein [Nanoarchaeota archaeon]